MRTFCKPQQVVLFLSLVLLLAVGCWMSVAAAPVAQTDFDCANVTQIPQSECEALVALYNSTNGPGWHQNQRWLATNEPCGWVNVRCQNGHVDQLYLYDRGLRGSIPPELGNLKHLKLLWLFENYLSGSIPPELGNLKHLKELLLDYNALSGSIPPELGNLTNLKELWLQGNQLSGSIPPELGKLANLPNLQELDLSVNALSGSIPPELGDLANLQVLDLSINALSGAIPPKLSKLTNLRRLDLSYNALTATDDPALLAWLARKDPGWADVQTVAPTAVQASALAADRIVVSWMPIRYTGDDGYYEISYATAAAGPFTVHGVTPDKTSNQYTLTGLAPGTTYIVRVRTYTPPNGGQQNALWSDYSEAVSVVTPAVAPAVVNDRYDVAKDKTLYVDSPGVLANDLSVNGEPRVYYQTDGRQVYELGWYNNLWHNRHITADPAWPLPAGKSMTALAVNNAPQLYYASSDGHVHYLAWHYADRDWHYAGDITAQVGGPPPVDGTLTAVTVNDNPRIYYLAADGYVHELAWVTDKWHYRNVTIDAGGPPAIAGSALGVSTITNDDPRIYYLAEGVGGLHVHELAWRSLTHVWYHGDLTAIVAGDQSPLDRRAQGGGTTPLGVMTADHYPRVAYLAPVNGETHVVEYYWDGAEYSYKYNDITQLTSSGIAQPNSGSPLIATTVDKQGDPRLYYQGRVANTGDAHIYELGWYENQWHFRDVTGDGAGLPPNLDSLMSITAAGSLPQVYYFNDRTIHQLAWHYPNNWQDTNLGSDPAWPKAIYDSPLSAITVKERSLSAKLIGDVAHGKLALYPDGSFVYTPTLGFSGRDSFTYVATTDFAESAATTVELEVTDECAKVVNNLIRNFCFGAGRSEWRFHHKENAGEYTVSADNPYAGTASAMITIRAPSSNVQFYQKALTLEPKTTYELAFAAYADSGEDMRVFLQQHDAPYTNYGLRANVIPLESYWKYFTFTFTTPEQLSGPARLRFWFAPYADAGTVYHIDRVLLRKTSDIYGPAEPVMASAIDEDFERELLAGAEVPDEPVTEPFQLFLPFIASE